MTSPWWAHDIGGMVTYAYLREFTDLPRAVIMDVPVPGVDLWDEFVREPFLWHFALHTVPDLPELLTAARHEAYFGYFFDLLSAHPGVPSAASPAGQAAAYAEPDAMSTGFGWVPGLHRRRGTERQAARGPAVATPLLLLRGSRERGGDIGRYAEGFRRAGVTQIESLAVDGAGHFPQEGRPKRPGARSAPSPGTRRVPS